MRLEWSNVKLMPRERPWHIFNTFAKFILPRLSGMFSPKTLVGSTATLSGHIKTPVLNMAKTTCEVDTNDSWTIKMIVTTIEIIHDKISWIKQAISTPWVSEVIELLFDELDLLKELFLIIQNIKKDNPKFLGPQNLGFSIIKCGDLLKELGGDFIDSSNNIFEYITKIQKYRDDLIHILCNEGFPTTAPNGYSNLLMLLTGVEDISVYQGR